ncbi:MAG TPA: hypothetical protein VFG23_19165 [Polyangia bacterium]|nr:hypothetical protein [Polyangia bacterium]
MMQPELDEEVVSTDQLHRVRLAIPVKSAGARFFVVECRCGWSSALMGSRTTANDAYSAHKREAVPSDGERGL